MFWKIALSIKILKISYNINCFFKIVIEGLSEVLSGDFYI